MARTALRRARCANSVVAQSVSSMSKKIGRRTGIVGLAPAPSAGLVAGTLPWRPTWRHAWAPSSPERAASVGRAFELRQLLAHVGDVRADQDHERPVLLVVPLALEEEAGDRDLRHP